MDSVLSLCLNRLTGWTHRWMEEGERSGEMDRTAAEILSIFPNHQGDGEMEGNVKTETDRN